MSNIAKVALILVGGAVVFMAIDAITIVAEKQLNKQYHRMS